MSAIIGVVCIVLAITVNLLGDVMGWLSFQGYLLIPLFSVILVDYFIVHKSKYISEELFNKQGKYRFFKGFNIIGYISWVAGAITFFAARNSMIGGALISMVVSGLFYVVLHKLFAKSGNVDKSTDDEVPVSQ
jgi:nucleobase:cation symporter-1, NCS1 family